MSFTIDKERSKLFEKLDKETEKLDKAKKSKLKELFSLLWEISKKK